jgi:hypothetical protein
LNKRLLVYKSLNISQELNAVAKKILSNVEYEKLNYNDFILQDNTRYLFIVELNSIGMDYRVMEMIEKNIKKLVKLENSYGAVIVRSSNEQFTKSFGQKLIYHLNSIGMEFMGHPLVEAVEDYKNFRTWKKTLNMELDQIFLHKCKELVGRLMEYKSLGFENPNILVLHAGNPEMSNTIMFFDMIKKHIHGNVRVLHVENGNIVDCKGCSFKTCLYYGEKNSCFYGGAITEEVLPAIEKADIVIWLCPNYNDSVSAKLMAVINRMTVLYRKMSFHEKYIYGVIVSGSSGGDSVSSQLLNSLCINKGFRLPANFSISQISYERGEVLKIPGIRCLGKKFAGRINNIIK